MDGYRLLIKASAVKELEEVPRRDRPRVAARISALADDPRQRGCEKLSGAERYRVRQGNYRIVYDVDDAAMEVTIYKIGHRRDVYR